MTNAEMLLKEIEQKEFTRLEEFVNEKQSETEFLDFIQKCGESGIPSGDDKKNYAKALSGFSNTAGGIVVWGIAARKDLNGIDAAQALVPIKNVDLFCTRLTSLLSEALDPVNPGIYNKRILRDPVDSEGFIITYVPPSDAPPHRALLGVNDYRLRSGDSFVPMSHATLADAFSARRSPKFKVSTDVSVASSTGDGKRNLRIQIKLKNEGRHLAKYPAVALNIMSRHQLAEYGIDGNGRWFLHRRPIGPNKYIFAGGINDVIHPQMEVVIACLRFPASYLSQEDLYRCEFDLVCYAEGYATTHTPIIVEPTEMWK